MLVTQSFCLSCYQLVLASDSMTKCDFTPQKMDGNIKRVIYQVIFWRRKTIINAVTFSDESKPRELNDGAGIISTAWCMYHSRINRPYTATELVLMFAVQN